MAQIVIPAQSDIALALREPNLLVPGKKPVGDVVFDSLNQNINDFVVWNPLLASGRSIVGVQPTYGSSATLPITPTRYGLASYLGESTNDYLAFSPTGGLSAPFTFLLTADFVSTAGSAARIVSANSNRFEIAFYLSQIRGYFGSSWKAFSPSLSQDLSFYSLAIVYDPSIPRVTAYKYKNGVMTTHILDPGSVGSITTITLCNNTGGGAERAVSKVLDFRIYSSVKTEEEIYRIFKNYWRGLKPANETPYLLSIPGASGPTIDSITMSNVQQTTATATVAVTI